MKRTAALDSVLLAFVTAWLIGPLFSLEYLGNWSSIESTFIADSRMLREHFPHPGWQPLWYCGTRFDYVYPPALRYGTALLAWAGHVSTARSYHIYTGLIYAAGIVSVYWLTLVGSGSRRSGLLAAAMTALVSPSFLFLPVIRHDSPLWIPQRLHVLMQYGEGPHICALSLLTAALAASWAALRGRRPAMLGLAAALCALVVAHNFYGGTALGIFFPILVWAVWTGERDGRVWVRALAIAGLAYGLSAFWLTPSYLQITMTDLKWVAQPGNRWSIAVAVAAVALYCGFSARWADGRRERAWSVFVIGLAVMLSLDVLGWFAVGFHVTGDSQRLIPELDLALILVFVEGMRALWKKPRLRWAVAALIVLALLPAAAYLGNRRAPFPASQQWQQQYEYRLAQWVHEHLPGERVLTTGSVRFWFDAWFDNAETDGGSSQGMLNQIIPVAIYQILQGADPRVAVLWMQALGTDAMVVPDARSAERYHDFKAPERFRGAAPLLFDDGQGTAIYRIPRVHPGLGRVVETTLLAGVGELRGGDDGAALGRYVAVVEKPGQPLTTVRWDGFDHAEVKAAVGPGQSILIQETYDPAWRATEGGKPVTIRREPFMGFMLIDAAPGLHQLDLAFETPTENRLGWALFAISAVGVAGLMLRRTAGRTKNRALVRPASGAGR